jgi:hypothetical protein
LFVNVPLGLMGALAGLELMALPVASVAPPASKISDRIGPGD